MAIGSKTEAKVSQLLDLDHNSTTAHLICLGWLGAFVCKSYPKGDPLNNPQKHTNLF